MKTSTSKFSSFGALFVVGALVLMAASFPALSRADTTPVLSNIVAVPTDTGATITWSTDQNTNTQVSYGTSASYGSMSTLDTGQVTGHSVALSGLVPNTTYHFEVMSSNSTGTQATSSDETFTTLTTGSTTSTAYTVWALDNSFVSNMLTVPQGAVVTWRNNGGTDHTVTSDSGLFSSGNMSPGMSFSYTFNTPGTYPYYSVYNGGPGGSGMSGTVIVTPSTTSTMTTAPVATSNSFTVDENGSTSGTLGGYDTNSPVQPITFTIVMNPANGTLSNVSSSGGFTYTPNANFSGTDSFTFLASNGTVSSSPATETITVNTTSTQSTSTSTSTTASTTPVVSNVSVTSTDTMATITWTTDQPSNSLVGYGLSSSYSAYTPTIPDLLTSHSVTLFGLAPGTTYHYQVMSTASGGTTTGTSTDQTFTTSMSSTSSTSTTGLSSTDIQNLRDELNSLISQLSALIQQFINTHGTLPGGGTITPPNSSSTAPGQTVAASLDQIGGTAHAGSSIDFGGRNFGSEEPVTVSVNGQTIATAHADGGGNFSTGSLSVPMTTGPMTVTFTGQNSGISLSETVNVVQ